MDNLQKREYNYKTSLMANCREYGEWADWPDHVKREACKLRFSIEPLYFAVDILKSHITREYIAAMQNGDKDAMDDMLLGGLVASASNNAWGGILSDVDREMDRIDLYHRIGLDENDTGDNAAANA